MKLRKRGYTVSPFFVAALMILGVVLVMHFALMDTQKTQKIIEEGKLVKESLEKEGDKAALETKILFLAYEAAYNAANPAKSQKEDPMSSSTTLKDYLIKEITEGLGGKDSTITVEIIDNDEIRGEGFIVRVTMPQKDNEKPVMLEKFVNARIFLLQELLSDTSSVDDGIKSRLAERMGYIWCGLKGKCSYSRADNLITCQWNSITGSSVPPSFMRDINQINSAIVDRIPEVERDIVDGKKAGAGLTNLQKENVGVGIDLKDISKTSISTSVSSFTDKSSCCKRDIRTDSKGNKKDYGCLQYDNDYNVQIVASGKIALNVLFIDYAGFTETPNQIIPPGGSSSTGISVSNLINSLNKKSSSKNYKTAFEVCAMSPIMLSDGSVKSVEKRKTIDVNYKIVLKYRSECKVSSSQKTGLTASGPIINYYYDEDSLKFTDKTVSCSSKSSGSYLPCKSGYGSRPSCGCGK